MDVVKRKQNTAGGESGQGNR